MQWTTVANMIRNVKASGIQVTVQKNWIRLDNDKGVTIYVAQPTKGGTTRKVHLSGHGYDGKFDGQDIPVKVRTDLDNGRVAFEYDMDTDGGRFLEAMLAALPRLEPSARPGARRGGRQAGPGPDVKADLGL